MCAMMTMTGILDINDNSWSKPMTMSVVGYGGESPHTFGETTLLLSQFNENDEIFYKVRRRTLSEVLPYKATDKVGGSLLSFNC